MKLVAQTVLACLQYECVAVFLLKSMTKARGVQEACRKWLERHFRAPAISVIPGTLLYDSISCLLPFTPAPERYQDLVEISLTQLYDNKLTRWRSC